MLRESRSSGSKHAGYSCDPRFLHARREIALSAGVSS